MKKALVVGAGFAGAVVARELAEAGWKVLVIDKRDHIGGNAYDYINEHGIRVHKYGPHLWHGNSDLAQNWASQFTEWVEYQHKVRAQLPDGRTTPLPINERTIQDVFEERLYDWAEDNDLVWYDHNDDMELEKGAELKFLETLVTNREVYNSEDHVMNSVGKELCELFFAPYTKKMWGLELKDLPSSVASRIPNNVASRSDLYFPNDKYQFLPKDGYTSMFERIFDHPNITVKTSVDRRELPQFADGQGEVVNIYNWSHLDKFDAVFTSEPIDTYYGCDLGELPWRSIKCHVYSIPKPSMLDPWAPVLNFTHDGPFTRMTEWKLLPAHGSNTYWTTITVEEPCDYKDNNKERYYPVKTSLDIDPNRELYKAYRERAKADGIHFIGRCGTYTYTDMQPCINSTLTMIQKFLKNETIDL